MANFTIPNRPVGGDQRHIADIEADFDYITQNMDAMAGAYRNLMEVSAAIPGGTAVGSYLIAEDGTLVLASTNTSKAIKALWANQSDYSLPPSPKLIQWGMIANLACNTTPPGASVVLAYDMFPYTVGGATGGITYNLGASQGVGNGWGSGGVAAGLQHIETGSNNMPVAGAYLPVITLSGAATAAASFMVLELQLFVRNV